MPARRPSISPTLRIALVDDGMIAYDTTTDALHHLNATAAALVHGCRSCKRGPDWYEGGPLRSTETMPHKYNADRLQRRSPPSDSEGFLPSDELGGV